MEKLKLDYLKSLPFNLVEIITEPFYKEALGNKEYLRVNSDLTRSLEVNESTIQLSSFIKYLNPRLPRTKGGLRFYPSFDNGKLKLLMEDIADNNTIPPNPEFFDLREPHYDSLPSALPKQVVEPSFISYFENIVIDKKAQVQNDECKRARFYGWSEIEYLLFKKNGIDLSSPDQYSSHRIKIEVGYISEMLDVVSFIAFGTKVGSTIGFTTLLSVFDSNNQKLKNSIEIGSSCPPECGSLYW